MPWQQSKQTYPIRRFTSLVLTLGLVAGIGFAALHWQDIYDWWKLRDYQAPAPVAALATQTTMSDYGRKIFYLNQPEITEKSNFGDVCPSSRAEHTIVLGCYHGGQNGIYLLKVDDERLNGVEEVTAAHEMLHGVYERLSASEKDRVNALLQDYYANDLKDERIRKTIESYKKSEPTELVNEMHSIFGTEVRNLPAELETYYSQFFTNRSAVVDFAEHYQAEFTTRQDAVSRYDAQIAALKQQFDAGESALKNQQNVIEQEQARMVRLRTTDVAAYNAAVPAYNQLVDAYNSEMQSLKQTIDEYNRLVSERNAIAAETEELTKEISSDSIETLSN